MADRRRQAIQEEAIASHVLAALIQRKEEKVLDQIGEALGRRLPQLKCTDGG